MKRSKILSNVLFLLIIFALIYPPSRVWIISKLSFSPKVVKKENQIQLKDDDYDFQLTQYKTGNKISFDKFKNKVIFVNIWATWCTPCIAEMPSIDKLYKKYGDQIEFVMLTDDKKNLVRSYLEKNNYDFDVYFVRGQLTTPFNVKTIPTSYLIDKSGKIVVYKTGLADWNSKTMHKQITMLIKQ